MGVLRGAADGQRPPGLAPRPSARLQGHLPALQDDARLLRRAQGRLGLPRPAGRDRRRDSSSGIAQGRDRGLRHRRVQREVPRVGLRVPRGLERAHRADRLLGRPRRRLPHARRDLRRVGLVGAAPDLGQGPALRGPQGRPLLPALRHRAVVATSWRWATRTSSTRASTSASRWPRTAASCRRATSCWPGRPRRGRWSPTRRWRSTPSCPTSRAKAGPTEAPMVARRGG